MSANTIYIDISSKPQSIGISKDNINFTWVGKKDLSVVPSYNPNPNYPHNYRYPTRTMVTLLSIDHKTVMEFEAQDTTTSTWNDGTQAALNQCVEDLIDWINIP